jgi:hypothetical protein
VIVPSQYRWVPFSRKQPATLEVDGQTIGAGSTAPITVGRHPVTTRPAGVGGILVLAIDLPAGGEVYRFIDPHQLDRLSGVR